MSKIFSILAMLSPLRALAVGFTFISIPVILIFIAIKYSMDRVLVFNQIQLNALPHDVLSIMGAPHEVNAFGVSTALSPWSGGAPPFAPPPKFSGFMKWEASLDLLRVWVHFKDGRVSEVYVKNSDWLNPEGIYSLSLDHPKVDNYSRHPCSLIFKQPPFK